MQIDRNQIQVIIERTRTKHPLFAEYCDLLNKGLRKKALLQLDKFLNISNDWDYKDKSDFIKIIFNDNQNIEHSLNSILTTRLSDVLIKPALVEMTVQEPGNYLPFKWYGQFYEDLTFAKKAFKINPGDLSVKMVLLRRLECDLWLSTHHLPFHYTGELADDEVNLKLAFCVLESLDPQITSVFAVGFSEIKTLIENYKTSI